MPSPAKFILFIIVFCLDVRVHAGWPKWTQSHAKVSAPQLLSEPAQCWERNVYPCFLMSSAERGYLGETSLKNNFDLQLYLARGSLIERLSASRFKLVRGTLWLSAKNPLTIQTEFGEVRSHAGELWLLKREDRVVVRASGEDLELRPLGRSEALRLPSGCENWLGSVGASAQASVGASAQASVGLLAPIELKDHLRHWAKIYRGPKDEMASRLEDFLVRWRGAVDMVSQLHQSFVDRTLASLEQDRLRRGRLRQELRQDEKEARALFRQKQGF